MTPLVMLFPLKDHPLSPPLLLFLSNFVKMSLPFAEDQGDQALLGRQTQASQCCGSSEHLTQTPERLVLSVPLPITGARAELHEGIPLEKLFPREEEDLGGITLGRRNKERADRQKEGGNQEER